MQFSDAESLGLKHSFDMTEAPMGETFHYRHEDKQVIRFTPIKNDIPHPLVYAVTDDRGALKYIGSSNTQTLQGRWTRPDSRSSSTERFVHHHKSSRDQYIKHLQSGGGPLRVYAASIQNLRPRLPDSLQSFSDKEIATNLEKLWIIHWQKQLWNKKKEQPHPAFDSIKATL